MSTGLQTSNRQSVIEIMVRGGDQGGYDATASHTFPIESGSEIRLVFTAPSGMGPADFDVSVEGTSVSFAHVADVSFMANGKRNIGEMENDLILNATSAGNSNVIVRLLDRSGGELENLLFRFSVS